MTHHAMSSTVWRWSAENDAAALALMKRNTLGLDCGLFRDQSAEATQSIRTLASQRNQYQIVALELLRQSRANRQDGESLYWMSVRRQTDRTQPWHRQTSQANH